MLILKTLISLSLFCNFSNIAFNKQVVVPPPAVIKSAYTNIPEKDNWVTVPKGTVFVNINLSHSDHFKSEPLHSELFPYLGDD